MSFDDPQQTVPPPLRIDIESPEALRRWSHELLVPPEALQAAVLAVGPRLDTVKDYLTAGSAGHQQDG